MGAAAAPGALPPQGICVVPVPTKAAGRWRHDVCSRWPPASRSQRAVNQLTFPKQGGPKRAPPTLPDIWQEPPECKTEIKSKLQRVPKEHAMTRSCWKVPEMYLLSSPSPQLACLSLRWPAARLQTSQAKEGLHSKSPEVLKPCTEEPWWPPALQGSMTGRRGTKQASLQPLPGFNQNSSAS